MSRRGMVLFLAMGAIWGIPYLLIKVAVRQLSPVDLVFFRTGLASVILLPVAGARGALRPALRRWRPLLLYTLVELAIPWVLLSTAEQRLPSSLTGLLVAAVPLAGLPVGAALGQRAQVSRRGVGGLVLGLAGVGALLGFSIGRGQVGAVALVGVVVVGYAAGPVVASRWLSDAPVLGVVSLSLVLCTVGYAPLALTELPRHVRGETVAAVVTLSVVCTAVAFVLFFALIAEVGAVRATVITYLNPVVAVVLGVVFLHEPLGGATAVGFVLILTGSWLATGARSRASSPAAPGVAQGGKGGEELLDQGGQR